MEFEDDYPPDGFKKDQKTEQYTVFMLRKTTRSKLRIQVEATSTDEAKQIAERTIGVPWQAVMASRGLTDVGNSE